MTSIEAFQELVRRYYEDDNPCGGYLHIFLDDGNIRDSDVDLCASNALEHEDLDGFVLAMAFRALTLEERAIILNVEIKDWMLNDAT